MNNTRITISLIAAAGLLCSCAGNQQSAENQYPISHPYGRVCISDASTVAHTIYGDVQGYKDGEIYTFKGITYAKAERFMPPQAPDKHEGVEMCRFWGPKAPQDQTLKWKGNVQTDYAFGEQFATEPMDEEGCMVLNVWTKGLNDGKKRPVFVWVHGGGYMSGSARDLPCYEGRALAEKGDIVVVSFNHRLNVLGFLDLTALGGKFSQSVNLGLMDDVKVLEWVRDNIENFGGDPSNVTVAGQSGGARQVSTLLAMPSASGLFNRAIVQSGSQPTQLLPAETQPIGLAVARILGITAANGKEKECTYEQIVAAYNSVIAGMKNPPAQPSPVVDGTILPQHPFMDGFAPFSKDVALMVGSNFCELSMNNTPLTEEEARVMIEGKYGDNAATYIDAFKKVFPDKTPRQMVAFDINYPPNAIYQASQKYALGGAPVYAYNFFWHPKTNVLGASHGMELPFMFNNVMLQPEMTGNTPEAHQLENLVSSAWLAFIKTGNPNVPGLPEWAPFTPEVQSTMVFDDECCVRVNDENYATLMSFSPNAIHKD